MALSAQPVADIANFSTVDQLKMEARARYRDIVSANVGAG
jgi:hypothetical protein